MDLMDWLRRELLDEDERLLEERLDELMKKVLSLSPEECEEIARKQGIHRSPLEWSEHGLCLALKAAEQLRREHRPYTPQLQSALKQFDPDGRREAEYFGSTVSDKMSPMLVGTKVEWTRGAVGMRGAVVAVLQIPNAPAGFEVILRIDTGREIVDEWPANVAQL